ncbi:MAG TPA: NADPH-dependent FMN reductase, partial [Gemmatimonadales bacterium]|nr:NADPH-dependent FMN reductase [Gemmatimonadales bacterium]
MSTINLLSISGSLRARSINTEVLRAAALVAPPEVRVTLFDGLGALPHFNPDLDGADAVPPAAIQALRSQIAAADGMLICTPEYAHGLPGTLKNALDWLVSGPEIIHKPIVLLNASPRSTHAQASLAETLRTMSAQLVAGAAIDLPIDGRRLDAREIAADPALAAPLRSGLEALVGAVAGYRPLRAA